MKSFHDKFKVASRGLLVLLSDKSVVIQLLIALFVIGFYWLIGATWLQLIIILIMCIIVISCEMINTCLERILDFICPEYNQKIGLIKDMSAGFVLFVAIGAAIVGIIILGVIIL